MTYANNIAFIYTCNNPILIFTLSISTRYLLNVLVFSMQMKSQKFKHNLTLRYCLLNSLSFLAIGMKKQKQSVTFKIMKDTRISTFRDFVGELTATYKRTALESKKITSAQDATDFMRVYFTDCIDDHEEVKVLHLNRANKVVNVHHVTSGSDTASIVPIKDIIQKAMLIKTNALILFHNHPSGNLKPSSQDIKISKQLKQACQLVDLDFLDSIVITRESYYSLAEGNQL